MHDHNITDGPEYVRLVGGERRVGPTLESVSNHWRGSEERFMFISPHDDDVVLGGGLLMQLAQKENVSVYILIVTDGSMGYCHESQKDTISKVRMEETYKCYESLGVARENIIWLSFPDCRLSKYRGRDHSDKQDKISIAGYCGLQNSFTYWIRKIAPTQCFLPTSNDLHPDHKIVHEELLISLFHAAGNIWPELGDKIEKVPYVHEMGVYCDFPEPPQLRVKAPESVMAKKLEAILMFKSQEQIESLVEIVRKSGSCEYFRPLEFKFYHPATHYDAFEKKHHIPFIK